MTRPPGLLSMEDMRKLATEELYDLMFECQSPGYYQFCVEELQRRYLTEIGKETQKLAESSTRVEALTASLEVTVKNVGTQAQSLNESSQRMERLTKWVIGLTVALFILTAFQLVIVLRDELILRKGERKSPAVAIANQPPTATEVFHLRSECATLGEKILNRNFVGAALFQSQISHYNPETNRCYVELIIQTADTTVDISAPQYYLHSVLHDGQTSETLASALIQHGKKSGSAPGVGLYGFDNVSAFIDKMMADNPKR